MKTVKEIVIDRKIRKGPARKITKDGAYWEVSTCIRSHGGDGFGQNSSDLKDWMDIRHYRSGEIRGYITMEIWHQNDGTNFERTRADDLLDCATIEDIIQAVSGHLINDTPCGVSAYGRDQLILEFPELPLAEKSPDDE